MTRYKTLLLPSVAVGLFAVAGLAATASEKRPAPHSKAEGSKTAVMTQAVQAKLTPEQINAAMTKYIDVEKMIILRAGDFAKAEAKRP